LPALQAAVAARCWPGIPILVDAPVRDAAPLRLLRAADLEQELQACAHWCRAHVERNAGARLLVLSACIEPSLPIQGALLWRALAPDAQGDEVARARWLGGGGGRPLLHQAR